MLAVRPRSEEVPKEPFTRAVNLLCWFLATALECGPAVERASPQQKVLCMTTQSQAILDAALALPEAERLQLVDRLLETLPAEQDDLTDDEWYAELERRHAEFLQNPSVAAPGPNSRKNDRPCRLPSFIFIDWRQPSCRTHCRTLVAERGAGKDISRSSQGGSANPERYSCNGHSARKWQGSWSPFLVGTRLEWLGGRRRRRGPATNSVPSRSRPDRTQRLW